MRARDGLDPIFGLLEILVDGSRVDVKIGLRAHGDCSIDDDVSVAVREITGCKDPISTLASDNIRCLHEMSNFTSIEMAEQMALRAEQL